MNRRGALLYIQHITDTLDFEESIIFSGYLVPFRTMIFDFPGSLVMFVLSKFIMQSGFTPSNVPSNSA